jgi:hypothetical protein
MCQGEKVARATARSISGWIRCALPKTISLSPDFSNFPFIVILSEAKNPSCSASIEEGFFASLRMTIK